MSYSLVSFHFNPYKLGQICKQYAKDRGISQAAMAARTGLSYDTVGNIYAGKVQKIPLEYVFKLCVVLAIPIEVIMMLMLKEEDIDFADQVMIYDTAKEETVPVEDAVPTLAPSTVPETVVDTAVAVAAAPVPELPASDHPHNGYTSEEMHAIIERVKAAHAAHLADVKATHAAHVQDLKDQIAKERDAATRHSEQLHALAMSMAGARH